MQRRLFIGVLLTALVLAGVLLFVTRPRPTAASTPTTSTNPAEGARFAFGPEGAKVTVVEFSNYLCPHCRDHDNEVFPQIQRDYINTGKVRYLFRDLPFSLPDGSPQPNVVRAGEAAACAAEQNRYLEYREILFRSQTLWGGLSLDNLDKFLEDLARQLSLDTAKFTACLTSGSQRAGVLADQQLAGRLGISETPTFIVNGQQYVGARSYEEWKALLDKALAQK
ncbi:DsbA family protein [Meiothermus granaticius]|uniref:Disulfide bond formation protein D n=1 Tax=Meiothermus granaticius NBRC 107808 TaxID=1227551 RepID=A0A399F8H1_9DEIN|nr:thioredoxin domain-containing protein [Meiothermus granaticius]RIH92967.1 Disulfide bond formation protein D [Meiothermus granaticius NBRC 107808]GEM86195.1 thiol:disulfide interchange protein [Meiothermus granaticius NBRC 107808]